MSIESHIEQLTQKHAVIEEKLHQAYIHHLPTANLKKEKLQIKDEIALLKNEAA